MTAIQQKESDEDDAPRCKYPLNRSQKWPKLARLPADYRANAHGFSNTGGNLSGDYACTCVICERMVHVLLVIPMSSE